MEGMVASPRDLEFLKEVRARHEGIGGAGHLRPDRRTSRPTASGRPPENLKRAAVPDKTDDIADVQPTPQRRPREGRRDNPRLPAKPAGGPGGHQEPRHRQGVPAVHACLSASSAVATTTSACLSSTSPAWAQLRPAAASPSASTPAWSAGAAAARRRRQPGRRSMKMLEGKGFKRDFILERMRTFVGLKIPALEATAG